IVPGASVNAAKAATREGVSKGAVRAHHLSTREAVTTASRVFPIAIADDVAMDPKVVALAKNAPAAIAGHTQLPHSRQAASAQPLGGHTGLALGCSDATLRPNLATRKYATPIRTSPSALRATNVPPSSAPLSPA